MVDRLKLRARDPADMDVMAALLQDALVPVADMAFLRRERRFVLVVNRFMWERAPEVPGEVPGETLADDDARFEDAAVATATTAARYWRSHTGLTFERVKAVASRNLPRSQSDAILNLLTVASEPKRIVFHFSGGAQLRLEVGEIRCHMEDLGDPWPTGVRPAHDSAP